MKVIGLIGGMSWNSTLEYYRLINEEVSRRLGSLHSAHLVLYSLDFEEIEPIIQDILFIKGAFPSLPPP